jgi:hypothetical protein
MVNIRVGKGRNTEVFAIHKHKLCHDSSYFQVALDDELPVEELFVVPAIQHLDFDKISPQVFRLFFRWCYSQSIKDENTRKFPDYTIIIQLWVLSGIIMSPDVQNIAIKSLCALKESPVLKISDISMIEQYHGAARGTGQSIVWQDLVPQSFCGS